MCVRQPLTVQTAAGAPDGLPAEIIKSLAIQRPPREFAHVWVEPRSPYAFRVAPDPRDFIVNVERVRCDGNFLLLKSSTGVRATKRGIINKQDK